MAAFNVMYSAMDNVGINYTVTNTDDSGINIQNYTVYEGALVLNQDAYIGHMSTINSIIFKFIKNKHTKNNVLMTCAKIQM